MNYIIDDETFYKNTETGYINSYNDWLDIFDNHAFNENEISSSAEDEFRELVEDGILQKIYRY